MACLTCGKQTDNAFCDEHQNILDNIQNDYESSKAFGGVVTEIIKGIWSN